VAWKKKFAFLLDELTKGNLSLFLSKNTWTTVLSGVSITGQRCQNRRTEGPRRENPPLLSFFAWQPAASSLEKGRRQLIYANARHRPAHPRHRWFTATKAIKKPETRRRKTVGEIRSVGRAPPRPNPPSSRRPLLMDQLVNFIIRPPR
jgi:hypothetical protein